jgi:hypothetical protein
MIVDFKEKPPKFGEQNHDDKATKTKDPYKIFTENKKSKGTVLLDMRCSCTDSNCRNKISFYYNGLNHYFSSKNLGSDTEVSIQSCDKAEGEKYNNVMWDPTEENVLKFTNFAETAREAITFKQKLLNGLYAQLQVRIKGYNEIQIMVRKEDSKFLFILFEIPNACPRIPLLNEAKEYHECLGVIATLPTDTDTSKIKNDWADMKNPFFAPIINWVKLLGEENQLTLEINNIWVMPE